MKKKVKKMTKWERDFLAGKFKGKTCYKGARPLEGKKK